MVRIALGLCYVSVLHRMLESHPIMLPDRVHLDDHFCIFNMFAHLEFYMMFLRVGSQCVPSPPPDWSKQTIRSA